MYLSDTISYSSRPDPQEHRYLYTYIRDLAHHDDDDAIDRFYRLLWDGNAYPNQAVSKALKAIVTASNFEQQSLNLINRCYYTLANLWHMKPNKGEALTQLILRLEGLPEARAQNQITRKLRAALQAYRQDERYQVLKKHLRLVRKTVAVSDQDTPPQSHYFGDLFPDYFFLYEAGTQTPDISHTSTRLNEGILHKRNQRLKQFGQDLNRFYVRSHHTESASNANPTHLSDDDLLTAINLYRPKRSHSFKRQADQFKTQTHQMRSVGDFKHLVLDHVAQPIGQMSGEHRRSFNHLFQGAIAGFQANMPLTQVVRIQMFSRLINAIINDSRQAGVSFQRFIHNTGTNIVTSLLLNMVLSCEMVRFELEKRLANLHHQFCNTENAALKWLLEAFDHMNVALALNAKYLGYLNLTPAHTSAIPDSM